VKKFIATAVFVCTILMMTACATGGDSTEGTVPLDQAIQEAARNIEDNVEAGQIIAILNFSSPTEQFSEYVIDELSILLANGRKLVVVDRRELDLIRQEEQFQLSGDVSDESALSIGRKLGAQYIVSGSLNSMGNAYRFRIRVLNVETAVFKTGSTADLRTGETKVAYMLSGARPAPVAVQQPTPAPSTTPAPQSAPANMVRINGGTFTMGSPSSEPGRNSGEVQHQVTVSSFYMGKYEVTQKEYQELMGTNPSDFKGDNLPVVWVSWYDAIEYCNALSRKEGLTPAYMSGGGGWTMWNRSANGYRLPTEAEWEYACRAGTTTAYNTGANINNNTGWYNANSAGSTQEVGRKPANAWGLYDMHGNVVEWCWDWYGDYSSGAQTDPVGASSGSIRVLRGGNWDSSAQRIRSACRGGIPPSFGDSALGFRLVRNG
jgi:formylglycine-generating enzyme required for sulfatase activity